MRFGRHGRFYLAALIGAMAGAATLLLPLGNAARVLVTVDVCALAYLALLLQHAGQAKPADLRRHAAENDEGMAFILLVALAAVAASLAAILLVLNAVDGPRLVATGLALAAIPLGWAMIHALLALHYAHEFYTPDRAGEDAGGLTFPGKALPGLWDFFYFAYGIGMTAQVSDVVVNEPEMRRRVLLHSVGSFFYNTVILALAVNAAIALAGQGAP